MRSGIRSIGNFCIFATTITPSDMGDLTSERPDINTITEHYIDVEKMLGAKGVRLPKFVLRWVERLIHVPELNSGIYLNREYFGLEN